MPPGGELPKGKAAPKRRELSAEEKMERGRRAITTLATYRKLKAADATDARLDSLAAQLKLDMPYFGYGYIKDRAELVPYIPVIIPAAGAVMMFLLAFIAVNMA